MTIIEHDLSLIISTWDRAVWKSYHFCRERKIEYPLWEYANLRVKWYGLEAELENEGG